MEKAQMPQHSPALGLSPVARALIAGTVTAVLPPPRRSRVPRCVTVTLSTDAGELAVLVPASHKIYARVASRARRGDFWVVEADLVWSRGHTRIRARHVLSSRDTYLPRAAPAAAPVALGAKLAAGGPARGAGGHEEQLGFGSW